MASDEAKPRRTTCDESAQAIRKYLDELRLEVEKLEAQVAELQEEALPKSAETGAVRLNVGGDTGFELFREQFDCFPKSLLHSIVTGRWGGYTSLDDDGRIFLDLDPAQFRCVLDWAFEGAESERRRAPETSEPQTWGLDLLLRFLGLAEDPATIVGEPKVKLDPEDGAICTYTEILCKYAKEFSTDEIRDYWLNCMESVRNSMPCYRPVMMCNGMPVRDQLTSQQSSQIDEQMPRELAPVLGEWTQVEENGKKYWRNEKLGVSSWKDPRRTTTLFQAALDGNLFFLQLYTEVGGFLDAVDGKGRTALHYNCAGGSSQAVHYLLQHGASVHLPDLSGSTPLHWAARYGHAPIVRLLLDSKASPDEQNNMGDTAMHEAAALGLVEPLQWLVVAKANLSLRNRESRTPLEVAERAPSKEALQLLQRLEDDDLEQSESDAARTARRERRALAARAREQVTSPEHEESSGEDDSPSLALAVVRAARPLLRSVQWLANRVLGEKKTNLGDTSQFSYDHMSGQWVLQRQPGAEEESASSEDQTWSLPEKHGTRHQDTEDGGMA